MATTPLPQAQACMLLQKSLPVRELRLCFEDPEWEQLVGQILEKVTEVRAVGSLPTLLSRVGLWDPGPQLGAGCPRRDVPSPGVLH